MLVFGLIVFVGALGAASAAFFFVGILAFREGSTTAISAASVLEAGTLDVDALIVEVLLVGALVVVALVSRVFGVAALGVAVLGVAVLGVTALGTDDEALDGRRAAGAAGRRRAASRCAVPAFALCALVLAAFAFVASLLVAVDLGVDFVADRAVSTLDAAVLVGRRVMDLARANEGLAADFAGARAFVALPEVDLAGGILTVPVDTALAAAGARFAATSGFRLVAFGFAWSALAPIRGREFGFALARAFGADDASLAFGDVPVAFRLRAIAATFAFGGMESYS